MGQKVHPSGFRVGITKKHQSQWFARFNKHKYSQTVLEDRMIRDTLNQLFPELLNPTSKNETKRDQNARIKKSRITQIKIERNIVPYQIGIQIHAENCQLLKSGIKNLQVKREILVKLQKTRQYLTNLKTKLDNFTNIPGGIDSQSTTEFQSQLGFSEDTKKQLNGQLFFSKIQTLRKKILKLKTTSPNLSRKKSSKTQKPKRTLNQILKLKLLRAKLAKLLQNKTKRKIQVLDSTNLAKLPTKSSNTKRVGFKRKMNFGTKVTKRHLKHQRISKKRLRLRQFIRLRDRLLISKGLLIQPKGKGLASNKMTKKLLLSPTPRFLKDFSLNPKIYLLPVEKIEKILTTKTGLISSRNSKTIQKNQLTGTGLKNNIFNLRLRKKLVTIYVEQMKKKFLPHLNDLFIKYTNQLSNQNVRNLGYLKKWDFNLRVENLKLQPIEKLTRLVQTLREKFVIKLNLLQKEFMTFGSFTCNSSDILGLFQVYNFLIKLKELVMDLKKTLKHKIKTQFAISKIGGSVQKETTKSSDRIPSNVIRPNNLKIIESSNTLLPQKVFRKKLDNISDECQKMKFIEYLKDLVQKHRTENIYLYLASISESRQYLKEIKKELKENFDFYLPGQNSIKELIQSKKTNASPDFINNVDSKITEQVNNILYKLAKKHLFDRTFAECQFEELERRQTMWLKNLQLIPKISIKFFSVNSKSLNQKASVVSDSVVDALEKRKAFRKVIKSTKENLMRHPEIKGVKIQVAGRLNGAEIARTEWVRAGRVPLQTLRANLDYSYRTANTIYGIIGVKVWIFKGFAKLISK